MCEVNYLTQRHKDADTERDRMYLAVSLRLCIELSCSLDAHFSKFNLQVAVCQDSLPATRFLHCSFLLINQRRRF